VNKGSTPTRVNITDTVPDDVTLLTGSTMLEEYLEANKEIKFSYTIRSNSESPYTLPAAEADYFELGESGAKITTRSQEVLIRIKPPPTPVPTPAFEPTIEPEVEALLALVDEPSIETVPVVDITEQSESQPTVEEETVNPSIDGNVILNLILSCDKITDIDPQNNMIYEVCTLVNNAY
jgi:hypothetical protein